MRILDACILTGGLLAVAHANAFAQTIPADAKPTYIDIGKIRAPHYPVGEMWWDAANKTYRGLEFPKGDTNEVRGYSSVFFGGTDGAGALVVAGNYFRSPGNDFQAGPIVAGDAATIARSVAAWSKIWTVSSASIDLFQKNMAAGNFTIPQDILEWPAKGNQFAKDAAGARLVLNGDFAPFVDLNNDGTYNPYDGDYPKMKGSQMLWWMFNDNTAHPLTQTTSMMAEVAVSAYAYAAGTAVDNIIFYEYNVTNRGAAISGFHFGNFADFDITYAFDDFLGADSARRLGIMYNGNVGVSSGSRSIAAGVLMLEQPGEVYGTRNPIQNISSPFANGNPANGTTIYQELERTQRQQLPWTGDLLYECHTSAAAGDRRIMIASAPSVFGSNTSQRYAFAMIVADSAGICPNVDLSDALATADTAYERYWHPARVSPPSNPAGVPGARAMALKVYPIPTDGRLIVESGAAIRSLRIVNALGAVILVPYTVTAAGAELQTRALPAGIYHLRIQPLDNGEPVTATFIRQ